MLGFPAIDLISEKNFASKDDVKSILKIDISKPIILFTQHSVTTQHEKSVDQLIPSLNALKTLASQGVQVIITYPNNDAGGSMIIQELEKLKSQNIKNINISVSLGRWLYHGILNLNLNGGNVVCVGNSSSGIKETPAFLCPAVNIGSRQDGRLRAENVIDTDYKTKNIISAVEKCLYDKDFKSNFSKLKNPYGEGNAGLKIAEILLKTVINEKLITKRMTILNDKGKIMNDFLFCYNDLKDVLNSKIILKKFALS